MVKIVKVKKCHIYYDGMQLFSASDDAGSIYFFIRAATDATETVFVGVPITREQYFAALSGRQDISSFFSGSSREYLVIKATDELADAFCAEVSGRIPGYDFVPSAGLFIHESASVLIECTSENNWTSFGTTASWGTIPASLPTWAENAFFFAETQSFAHLDNLMLRYDDLPRMDRKRMPAEPIKTTFVKDGANENLQLAA